MLYTAIAVYTSLLSWFYVDPDTAVAVYVFLLCWSYIIPQSVASNGRSVLPSSAVLTSSATSFKPDSNYA